VRVNSRARRRRQDTVAKFVGASELLFLPFFSPFPLLIREVGWRKVSHIHSIVQDEVRSGFWR
jgi:hypothetical protein